MEFNCIVWTYNLFIKSSMNYSYQHQNAFLGFLHVFFSPSPWTGCWNLTKLFILQLEDTWTMKALSRRSSTGATSNKHEMNCCSRATFLPKVWPQQVEICLHIHLHCETYAFNLPLTLQLDFSTVKQWLRWWGLELHSLSVLNLNLLCLSQTISVFSYRLHCHLTGLSLVMRVWSLLVCLQHIRTRTHETL